MSLQQEGGETIFTTKTLSKNMDGLSNTACSYYLKKIQITCSATRQERNRYKNTFELRLKNPTYPGKMPSHELLFKKMQ